MENEGSQVYREYLVNRGEQESQALKEKMEKTVSLELMAFQEKG